jgi:hypothetical protein
MRYRLRTLMMVLALGPPMLGMLCSWHRINGTNCGGNNAALNDVRNYAVFIQRAADENTNGEFLISAATTRQCKQLAEIAHDPWLRGGQLLVSTKPYRSTASEPRRIVAVCDGAFANVPRRVFGEAPPTHAAGFSDGSTSLLTANEFDALDRSSFISLNEITKQSN